jgi:hypothetical protein
MFTHKSVSVAVFLLGALACGCGQAGVSPQETEPAKVTPAQPPKAEDKKPAVEKDPPKAPKTEGKEAAVAKDSPKIQELLKKRRDVLEELTTIHERTRKAGQGFPKDILEVSRKLLEAELALTGKAEERRKAYQAHFDRLKKEEELSGEMFFKVKKIGLDNYLPVKAARLEAEAMLLRAKNPEAKPDPPEVRKKLLECRDTLREERKVWLDKIEAGAESIETEIIKNRERSFWGKSVFLRLLEAELAVADKPADRIKAFQAYLDIRKEGENYAKVIFDIGKVGPEIYLAAKARRLEAEIWLEGAKSPNPKKDSPKVRELAKDWRDTTREEMKVWRIKANYSSIEPRIYAAGAYQRWLEAELAVASKPTDAVAAYQEYFDCVKEVETMGKEQKGGVSIWKYLEAQADRLEAEIWLLRAKSKLTPQELLKKRRDVLEELTTIHERTRKAGQGLPKDILEVSRKLLEAELALPGKAEERRKAYQAHFDRLKKEEELSGEMFFKVKKIGLDNYLPVKAARLEAEALLLRAKNTEAKPDPPEVRKKLLEWRDTLRKERKVWLDNIEAGAESIETEVSNKREFSFWGKSVFLRLLEAELAVADKPADRIKAFQAYLDIRKEGEKEAKGAVDVGKVGPDTYLAAKARRLEAEIWLERAKSPNPKKDSPKVRELAKDWRDTTREEMKAHLLRMEAGSIGPGTIYAAGAYQRLLEAELAVASKPTDAVAAYQAYFDCVKEVETGWKPRINRFVSGPIWKYLEAQADRLEAEIWLLRAKSKLPPAGK